MLTCSCTYEVMHVESYPDTPLSPQLLTAMQIRQGELAERCQGDGSVRLKVRRNGSPVVRANPRSSVTLRFHGDHCAILTQEL